MAKQSVSKRDQLARQVRETIPAIDIARDEVEVAFLLTYRRANKADKRRLTKILHGAKAGLLPPPEVSSTWTRDQLREFADKLPEAPGVLQASERSNA